MHHWLRLPCRVMAVPRRRGEVGEGTSPRAGHGQRSSRPWHLAPKPGCAGQRRVLGHRTARPVFPREPARSLLAQLPPPTGLGLGFLARLQILLHRSVCVSCASPSLGVLVFSDFCQLLMICEAGQQGFWGGCGIPTLNVSRGQSESLLSTK